MTAPAAITPPVLVPTTMSNKSLRLGEGVPASDARADAALRMRRSTASSTRPRTPPPSRERMRTGLAPGGAAAAVAGWTPSEFRM
jgi:hypothetical protein